MVAVRKAKYTGTPEPDNLTSSEASCRAATEGVSALSLDSLKRSKCRPRSLQRTYDDPEDEAVGRFETGQITRPILGGGRCRDGRVRSE